MSECIKDQRCNTCTYFRTGLFADNICCWSDFIPVPFWFHLVFTWRKTVTLDAGKDCKCYAQKEEDV